MLLQDVMTLMKREETEIVVNLDMFNSVQSITVEGVDYNPRTMGLFVVVDIENVLVCNGIITRVICTNSTKSTTEIPVKYFDDTPELVLRENGDYIDLCTAEDVTLKQWEYTNIRLGVAMQLPDGYIARVLPRSSTFKRYGILMTNSEGIIDNTYCGDNDEWRFPALATKDIFIPKHTRIAQFTIEKCSKNFRFTRVDSLGNNDRGGFGSTGR